MSLAPSRWIKDGTAILITGPAGSGKSWLAYGAEFLFTNIVMRQLLKLLQLNSPNPRAAQATC